MNGILIVDKPKEWTSHDVVAKIRNTLHVKKVGHGGTLDPTATGMLIVLVGTYTKQANAFLGLDKSYEITCRFGSFSTTGDEEGELYNTLAVDDSVFQTLNQEKIADALAEMQGTLPQQVPWFSAIKVDGKKLYQYARGKTVEELHMLDTHIARPVRDIVIYATDLLGFTLSTPGKYPEAVISLSCSSGTYTRVFVEDLAEKLGVPAYQIGLRRTTIGYFTLANAITEKDFGNAGVLMQAIQSPTR